MEATSWKKKHKSEDKINNSDYEDDDGLSLDSDDLDQKKRDKVGVGVERGGMDNNNNNI